MKFKEIMSCLTGLSTPVFGVSWQPPEPQVAVARRVITYLEDRRVLYIPSEMEVPHYCVQSVNDIRQYLTGELQSLDGGLEVASHIRAMRAACRKFLNIMGEQPEYTEYGSNHGHYASWVFMGALGELRGVFGVHIAQLAAAYGLDVEEELAAILPAETAEK